MFKVSINSKVIRNDIAAAVVAGFAKHGITVNQSTTFVPCDLGININRPYPGALKSVVISKGYLGDRNKYYGIGLNGLNGRGSATVPTAGNDRVKSLGIKLQPWRTDGDYVLIAGQKRGDRTISDCPNILRWWQEMASKYSSVYFRPHPLDPIYRPLGIKVLHGSLDEALVEASLLLSWSSNAAVDSVIAGVPVIVGSPYSMAYSLTAGKPERESWLADLSYRQWDIEEISTGAWLDKSFLLV